MDSILLSAANWLGLIGTISLTLVTYLAKKFLVPFLKIGNRTRHAQYISVIADDITDDLRARYPDNEWHGACS